jgi:hypothetical protein
VWGSRSASGLLRRQWDMPPPEPPASGIAHYEACAFVDLPVLSYFDGMDRANPRVVALPPINPAPGHSQPLSNRERAWLTRPALRHAQLVHLVNLSQLAERAQLREAVLVTQRGYRPPVDRVCTECARIEGGTAPPQTRAPFLFCVSGGFEQRCNNCLYRGRVRCSLAHFDPGQVFPEEEDDA